MNIPNDSFLMLEGTYIPIYIYVFKHTIFVDLKAILKKSRDYDELSHVWKSWRDASGKKMRNLFEQSVKLQNEGAKLNGKYKIISVSLVNCIELHNFRLPFFGRTVAR